jgi:hypothetical protein
MQMQIAEIKKVLGEVRSASVAGKVEDGTRVHIRYERIPGAKTTETAKEEAKRAIDLELPKNSYTGRVSRVWESKGGDMILTMYVELERDHKWRSFNVDQGIIKNIVILGD